MVMNDKIFVKKIRERLYFWRKYVERYYPQEEFPVDYISHMAILNDISKFIDLTLEQEKDESQEYADQYSKGIYDVLSEHFDLFENHRIGCNDVSDIVLNAILDACNERSYDQVVRYKAFLEEEKYRREHPELGAEGDNNTPIGEKK